MLAIIWMYVIFLAHYILPDHKKSNSTLENGQTTFCSIQFNDEHGENYKDDHWGSDDDGGYTVGNLSWCGKMTNISY